MKVLQAKWPQEQLDLFENCCVCAQPFKVGDGIAVNQVTRHAVHDPACTFLLPHCGGGRHQHSTINPIIGR